MKGNFHVQFLGEGVAATSPPYPTPGWATTQVYPARNSPCRVGKEPARRARSSFGFPLPPLKFRTVGFPQYGFKWTVSGDLRRHPGA